MAREAGKPNRAVKARTGGGAQKEPPTAKSGATSASLRPRAKPLAAQLDAVLAKLLRKARGSRTTLRIDHEPEGWDVSVPCAEALTKGAKSLRGDGSINQRAAATIKWLVKHRRNLVQPDVTAPDADPAPPPALIAAYGVHAQMLGPVFRRNGFLQGWISVHYIGAPHDFTGAEMAALDEATAEVKRLIGID